MEMVPGDIRQQVLEVADYFAETLPICEIDSLPNIPQWLSIDAQRWIKSNHSSFSELVLAAHREYVSQGTG